MQINDLEGHVVVVTGAGTGMGEATSRLLASAGARVALLGIDAPPLKALATELPGSVDVTVDVSDPGDVREAFATVAAAVGPISHVVHAAGIDDIEVKRIVAEQYSAGEPLDVFRNLSDAQWNHMRAVNLDGSFYVLREALRTMIPAGRGSAVLIGSSAAVHGVAGLPHYSASKGGVHGLIRSVAKEAAAFGVRINGIAPGVIDTPMSRRSGEYFGQGSGPVAPLGRKGTAAEIASVVLFLLSGLSSYVAGEVVNVDGGLLAS